VCDTLNGYCVGCLTNEDCAPSQYCEQTAHACASDICTPDSTQCSDDTLMTCNVDGTGFDQLACPEGCVSDDGPAHCADIIAPTCAGATADPCTSIPKFVGTQVVDGNPDEFCDVPYRIMTPQNAGLFAGSSGVLTTPSGTEASQAIVRVAWSSGFLHLHVRVVDATIIQGSGYEYNYDNVQLFVAPMAPNTGESMTASYCTGVTSYAQQLFMVPGDGDLWSASSRFVCSSWAPSSGYEYAASLTADGYQIEAKVPWSSAVAAGSTVGFDVMVGVNDTGVRDYEYGLYIEAGSSVSCGSASAKGLWCDAGLWCTPQLMN
jgi:hypothetical protein